MKDRRNSKNDGRGGYSGGKGNANRAKPAGIKQPLSYRERAKMNAIAEKIGKVFTATFSYSGRGFGFAVPIAEENPTIDLPDVFIPPRETKGAMTGDKVTVKITRQSDRGSYEGEVVSAEYSLSKVIGTLRVVPGTKHTSGYAYVVPDRKNLGINIYIPEKDVELMSAKDLDKVEVIPSGEEFFTRTKSITVRGPADMPYFDTAGRLNQVFGSSLDKDANYSAVLYASGIRTVFDDEVLRYADEVSAQPVVIGGDGAVHREDLRNRLIMTIDGAGAKDLDDAVSLERTADGGYLLGVHIADVSHYVRQESPVELEARLRGTSVYFTDKVVPMLPESLSNGACSLNAGEDKYALSAEITLDSEGNRLDTVIHKSVIRSDVRGVYEEVNDIFDNPESEYREKYSAVLGMLGDMRELYFKLKKKQDERGVMTLEDSDVVIILGDDGMPVDIEKRERGDAEKMIEQFMLQANMGVAEVLKSLNLPCLYRVHEQPSEEKLKNFSTYAHNIGLNTRDIVNEPDVHRLNTKLMEILEDAREKGIADTVSEMMLRSMMKAKYVSVCAMHFGLGADTYCHFTSPIRRYPDTFVHTVITTVLEKTGLSELGFKTVLDGDGGTSVLAANAEARGQSSTECEMVALTAERDIEDLYMALFMRPKVGEVFDVNVVSVIRSGMFVRCANMVEGFIPASTLPESRINDEIMTLYYAGKTYTIGTPVKAKLYDVDVSTRKITFLLHEGE